MRRTVRRYALVEVLHYRQQQIAGFLIVGTVSASLRLLAITVKSPMYTSVRTKLLPLMLTGCLVSLLGTSCSSSKLDPTETSAGTVTEAANSAADAPSDSTLVRDSSPTANTDPSIGENTIVTTAETTNGAEASVESNTASTSVNEAIEDIQGFWTAHGPDVEIEFKRVRADRLVEVQDLNGMRCGDEKIDPAAVENNAVAFDCAEGQAVVWDQNFIDDLSKNWGRSAPLMMVAHEFGHIVAYQMNIKLRDVTHEQFADCLSGVWVADAYERKRAPFNNEGELDATIASMLDIADSPEDSADSSDAHGLVFDRMRAFQEGFQGGAGTCASYEKSAPKLTQIAFKNENTTADLPLEAAKRLTEESLVEFATANPSVGTLTPTLRSLTIEELAKQQKSRGDGATFAIVATDTFDAANKPTTDAQYLANDCRTGAWLNWVFTNKSEALALSAGDLDESVAALVDQTDPQKPNLLFDRIDAMRVGFVNGLSSCA